MGTCITVDLFVFQVNSAGVFNVKNFDEATLADIDLDFNQFVRAAFTICKRAMPSLIANKGIHVIVKAKFLTVLSQRKK